MSKKVTIQYQAPGLIPGGQYAQIAYQYLKDQYPEELKQMCQTKEITEFLNQVQAEAENRILKRLTELKEQNPLPPEKQGKFQEQAHWHNQWLMTAREEVIQAMILTLIP